MSVSSSAGRVLTFAVIFRLKLAESTPEFTNCHRQVLAVFLETCPEEGACSEDPLGHLRDDFVVNQAFAVGSSRIVLDGFAEIVAENADSIVHSCQGRRGVVELVTSDHKPQGWRECRV